MFNRGVRKEVVEFRAEDSRLRASLAALGGAVKRINQRFAAMAASMKLVFASMSLGLFSIIRIGQQVEYALAEAGLASVATRKELEQMTALAEHLGRTTPRTTHDIALAMKSLAKAGFEVNEVLGLTPIIVKQAVAAGVSVEDSGIALIRVYKQFGKEIGDATVFVEQMLKLSTMANVTVTELGYRMGQAGETAKALGLEFAEAASGIALLSDVLGENSGIYFRALTKDLVEKQDELQELGIRVYDAAGGVRSLVEILRDFEELTKGKSAQGVAEITNVMGNSRSLVSLLNLLKRGSGKLEEFTRAAEGAAGTLDHFLDILGNTGQNVMYEMISAIQDLAIKLFKETRTELITFYQTIRDAARFLGDNIKTTAKIIKGAFVFTAAIIGMGIFNVAIGVTINFLGIFAGLAGKIIGGLSLLYKGLIVASGGFRVLSAAIAATTLRVKLLYATVTFGISLLVAGLIEWFVRAREDAGSTFGAIQIMWADLVYFISASFHRIKFGWQSALDYIATSAKMRVNDIKVVFAELAVKIEELANYIKEVMPDWFATDASSDSADFLAGVLDEREDLMEGYTERQLARAQALKDALAGLGLAHEGTVGDIGEGGGLINDTPRIPGSTDPNEPMTMDEFGATQFGWEQMDPVQRQQLYDAYLAGLEKLGEDELEIEAQRGSNLISEKEKWALEWAERSAEIEKERRRNEYMAELDHVAAMKALMDENIGYKEKAEKIRDTKQYKAAKSMHDDLLKLEQQGFEDVKALRKALAIMELSIDLATKPPEAYAKTSAAYPQPLGHVLGVAHAAIVTATLVKGMHSVAKMRLGGRVAGADSGVDSVHTMLTPGEVVIPKPYADEVLDREARHAAGGGADFPETITVVLQADGRTLARQVVEIASEEGVI